MRLGILLLLLIGLTGPTFAETAAADQAPVSATPSAEPQARAYEAAEFDPWMLQLRRAETLAIGAFPVAYLFAGLGYDYLYYMTNNYPSSNIPWPLGPGTSQWTTSSQSDEIQRKNWSLVGISLGLSVLLACADWALGF